jgi:hypothetical protein
MGNSFKDLDNEYDVPLNDEVFFKIEHRLKSNIKSYRFAGETSELYLPKVFKTIMAFAGVNDRKGDASSFRNRKNNAGPEGHNPHGRG